jgi:hypothetical protein
MYANLGSGNTLGLGVMIMSLYVLAIGVTFVIVRPRSLGDA